MKRIKGKNPRGVRLHHPDLRNCVLTIAEARMYPNPEGFACPTCQVTHLFKTHHITLDSNGDAVVHEDIYELFKREGIIQDLKATREVTPRPIVLDMANTVPVDIVVSAETGPVKLPGMNGHSRV